MDWIGEATSVVFGAAVLWQLRQTKHARASAKLAQLAAETARADARRLAFELDRIRVLAGTERGH